MNKTTIHITCTCSKSWSCVPTEVTLFFTLWHKSATASHSMLFNEDSQTEATLDNESKSDDSWKQSICVGNILTKRSGKLQGTANDSWFSEEIKWRKQFKEKIYPKLQLTQVLRRHDERNSKNLAIKIRLNTATIEAYSNLKQCLFNSLIKQIHNCLLAFLQTVAFNNQQGHHITCYIKIYIP